LVIGIACAKDAHVETCEIFWRCHLVERELARVAQAWEVDAFGLFFRMLYLVRMREEGKTSCGGSLLKEGCLVLNLYTVSLIKKMVNFYTVSWIVMMVFSKLCIFG
jgi:hypothetical protein